MYSDFIKSALGITCAFQSAILPMQAMNMFIMFCSHFGLKCFHKVINSCQNWNISAFKRGNILASLEYI